MTGAATDPHPSGGHGAPIGALDGDRGMNPAELPCFDGYPYLVTRIGRSALRHVSLVPADWPRDRIIELARTQANANRLETAACFGPNDTE